MQQSVISWLFEGQKLNWFSHDCDERAGAVKMEKSFGKILKQPTAKRLLPYLVLAVLFVLSVLGWQYYERALMRREERRYNDQVNRITDEITDQLHKYEMILFGSAGVFFASEEVTREDWRAYFEYWQVSTHYPGIHRIMVSRVVQPEELAQHIEEIRAEGFPDYKVWPDGEREIFTPLIYLEPFDDLSRRAFGYDMFSEPVRRSAMERARDTGSVVLTSKVTLVTATDQNSQPGFNMFIPIYAQGLPTITLAERRAAIEGYVAGSFLLRELMQGLFPDSMNEISFKIYDGVETSPETLLYESHITPDHSSTGRGPLFASQQTLDLYNHQLTLTFESMPAVEAAVDRVTPKGILAFGLLLSFLIFFYLRTLQTTGDRALSLGQEMTMSLRESEEKYRFLAENITDVIWTVDLEGNPTYISPAIEELLVFTPEEFMAMTMRDYMVQEDYDAMMELLSEELAKSPAERDRSVFIQARYRTKDNRLVHVELSVSWILDEQGNVVGIQGTTRDITARKQLEDTITASRKMYQSVVDTQQELVARYLPDTTLTFVNDAYCRSYGKSRQELLGQKFLVFTPPELHDELIELTKNLTPENPSVMHEHYVLAADGSIRWEEWSEQAFFTETGEIKEIQGVGRDITERVQAEASMLRAYDETIGGWSNALELRNEETEGHSRRVTVITLKIARMMNVKTAELVHVRRGALLHDIGKMGIPDAILLKPGPLTDEEWVVMRKHPVYAHDLLAPIDYLRPALDIPYCHHEKWDGTGYPRGLKGKAIPLAARIFAVVDVYDALTSDRPYRKAWTIEDTLEHIKAESGTHFDPQVVEVFMSTIENETI